VIAYHGGATRETGEPVSARFGTLWYSYTAPADEWLNVALEAESVDSYITVFNGDSFDNMQLISQADSGSLVVFIAAGRTYQICVANFGGSGENRSQVAFSTTRATAGGVILGPEVPLYNAPSNDSFAFSKTLSGNRLTIFGYTTQGTRESFEPTGTRNNTLWYKWGTDQAGNVTFELREYGLDAFLSVWKGDDLATLQLVRSIDSGSLTFAAEPNTTYRVALASYGSGGGLASFTLAGPGTGVVSTPSTAPRFINLSTRAVIAPGGNINPGFVISGTGRKRVVVRGAGPALAALGVPGVLPDPTLSVFSGSTLIASNNDWSSGSVSEAELRALFGAVGAFPFANGSRDAAVVLTLDPGPYTVILKDVNDRGGDALVEVYEVP
jgi:hypothetical protein